MHLVKAPSIKAEIDKLFQVGFIYPIEHTSWVSKPIPVTKKYRAIHICTNFCDMNLACPQDNYPMPFFN